ncbi:GNAT family N-acetyltransferase NDAI_0K01240 [Naumovozyma dairenensis CBS 421]|uniref:N-acetyltransferase domain-containing protein n=1 Tax=Naumovozyma dairenensis (strain ATCC 10597 / BCRC 20456 / CBS 421 / NBRC 0211 / NRRL Y-12639) TaxID=1071378 RepID=G0WHQ4_NAUDC|nr:hypothetical protein NDAI_0K01240 [Naumovozyma dairenensis CBS 421]CCD27315.1 hypothetical protein NDAI_0K01240 [Naumovozyma dairenensis CBS 421]
MGKKQLELRSLDRKNYETFRKLVNVILPISYPSSYFLELVTANTGDKNEIYIPISKLAFIGDVLVGGITCKLLPNRMGHVIPEGIYLELIVVKQCCQNKGVGIKLLNYVEVECRTYLLHYIYLHVSINNRKGIEWYMKRGFEKIEFELPGYYKLGNQNVTAIIMRKYVH